jgi:hypothetical protein
MPMMWILQGLCGRGKLDKLPILKKWGIIERDRLMYEGLNRGLYFYKHCYRGVPMHKIFLYPSLSSVSTKKSTAASLKRYC